MTSAVFDPSPELRRLADALRPALGLAPERDTAGPDLALAQFAARRHRVAPLLLRAWFADLAQARAAGEAGEFLAHRYMANCAAVLRQQAVASELRAVLAAEGIAHAEVKGRQLGIELYGEAAWRQAKDVDLLIDPARIGDALEMAATLGYREAGRNAPLDLRKSKARLGFHREVGIRHPTMLVEVELHSRLLNNPPPGWRDVPLHLSATGGEPGIEQPDYVLYLVVHGALTGWKRLKWLCDLVMLGQRVRPDVRAQVVARARELDCLAALHASFRAVEGLWGRAAVAPWLEQTADGEAAAAAHLAVFGRRLEDDGTVPLTRRLMRNSGLVRDAAVFGRHPPRARVAAQKALFWLMSKT
jgi:hypothetical protein